MLPSQALLPAVVFALTALQALASDTFIAAVYEHAVILPAPTEEPVSPDDALALMNKNMDVLEGAIREAAQKVWGCREGCPSVFFCSCRPSWLSVDGWAFNGACCDRVPTSL